MNFENLRGGLLLSNRRYKLFRLQKHHQTIMRYFSKGKIHVSKTLQDFSTSKASSNYNALFFQRKRFWSLNITSC